MLHVPRRRGLRIGDSLFEADQVDTCRALLDEHGDRLLLPSDITALGPGGELVNPAAGGDVRQVGTTVPDGWKGLDIGPGTAAEFGDVIAEARTVFWNGPMGVFEDPRFAAGTRAVAEAVADTAASPSSAAATARRPWPSSASTTTSTTCRPAAARRSSCSSRATCPGLAALRGEWKASKCPGRTATASR